MEQRLSSIIFFIATAFIYLFGLGSAIPLAASPSATSGGAASSSTPSGTASSSSPSGSGSSSGGSLGAGAKQGTATFYTFWTGLGSCGQTQSAANPDVVAIPAMYMKGKCGSCILIDYNGKTLKVKVTDTCPECDPTHLDLSDVAFAKLESKDKGKINIKWDFVPC